MSDPRVIVETLPRTRRLELVEGTRYTNVTVDIDGSDHDARLDAESRARQIALDAWCEKWGPIPWDFTEITSIHLTVQVMVDVRVTP